MADILQRRLPYDPMAPRPLPGIQPLALEDWLIADEAFAGQMAERARLLAERREAVLALAEGARGAALELLDLVLSLAYPGAGEMALRPDGIAVPSEKATMPAPTATAEPDDEPPGTRSGSSVLCGTP